MTADFDCFEVQNQRVLLTSSDPIFIVGDLNCTFFGTDSRPAKAKLLEFSDGFSLYQFVRSSTFKAGSLLDIFISNRETLYVNVLLCSYSDQCLIKGYVTIPKFRH